MYSDKDKNIILLSISNGFKITAKKWNGYIDIYIGNYRFTLVWINKDSKKLFKHYYSQVRLMAREITRHRIT